MDTPKISVIIPVYNVEKYLKECLDSVINQTLKEIEIICVDDGSADNSGKILDEYALKDNRIKVIHKKNEGAGVARDCALDLATGKYLAFLDGDDLYKNIFLEKMYKSASENNSDIVVCLAESYDICKKEYKVLKQSLKVEYLPEKEPFCADDVSKYIFNSFQNWNWNKIYSKDFVDKNKIRFQYIYRTNDLYFTCCSLVLADRITTVKQPLVVYRIGMEKNSQSTNILFPFDFYKAFKELKNFLEKENKYKLYKESYLDWFSYSILYNVLSIKNNKIRLKVLKYVIINGMRDFGVIDFFKMICIALKKIIKKIIKRKK